MMKMAHKAIRHTLFSDFRDNFIKPTIAGVIGAFGLVVAQNEYATKERNAAEDRTNRKRKTRTRLETHSSQLERHLHTQSQHLLDCLKSSLPKKVSNQQKRR